MITWAQLALKTKDVKKSKFVHKIRSIVESFNTAQAKFRIQNATPQEFLTAEFENDDSHCLTLLWFLIHAEAYIPAVNTSFLKWSIPTDKLEFDHGGCFKEISTNHYFYEAGESKGNYTSCTTFLVSIADSCQMMMQNNN